MTRQTFEDIAGAVNEEVSSRGLKMNIIRPTAEMRHTPEMDALIAEFHDIAVDSFGRHLPYAAIDGRTREADVLTVLRAEDGRALAYTVNARLVLDGVTVNYFATALARRTTQGQGFYRLINPLRAAAIPDAWALMTRTQNPLVEHSFGKVCDQHSYVLFPNEDMDPSALKIARAFAPSVDELLICKGVYDFGEPCGPRALMYDTPAPQTPRQKQIWSTMDVEKGDAVILVGLKG